ncbi:MAG: hypothetical protein SFU56_13300 [Capsulimonadales bacterium]|nr:hypothetical protein [Capsulimonadales bacterium]
MARMMAEPGMVPPARATRARAMPAPRTSVGSPAPPDASQARAHASRMAGNAVVPANRANRVLGAKRTPAVSRPANRAVGREMLAVLLASFIVSLLCCYVAAYARVTAEGFAIKRLHREIAEAEKRGNALQASISEHQSLERIAELARKMGLVPQTPGTVRMLATDDSNTGADAGSDEVVP